MIVFTKRPQNFAPKFEIAVLYGEAHGKFLFLLRQDHESSPNKWCLPGGGIHARETPQQCLVRETKEETGVVLEPAGISRKNNFFIKHPEYLDYVVHPFYYQFPKKPVVRVNLEEHKDFCWVSIEEALDLDLILGGAEQLQIFKTRQ